MAQFDGYRENFRIIGQDSRGQLVEVSNIVLVESSTRLEQVGAAPSGVAMEFRDSRLLYQQPREESPALTITNVANGTATLIPVPPSLTSAHNAHVISTGVIFEGTSSNSIPAPAAVYDWRNGMLNSTPGRTLIVKWPYAVFVEGSSIYRRDLTIGADLLVASDAINIDYDVAPNGDVVFKRSDGMYRYRNGQITTVAPSGAGALRTDGSLIVYEVGSPRALTLYDGTSTTTLVSAGLSTGEFQVNNGWVAFTRRQNPGTQQAWIRSPTGMFRQVTATGLNASIEALGADGTIVYKAGPRRYYSTFTRAAVDIGQSAQGRVVWHDGDFFMLIGRMALRLVKP
jgi:hypothetical protein